MCISSLDTFLQYTKIFCRFQFSLNLYLKVLGHLDGIFAHKEYFVCIHGIVTSKLLLDPSVIDQLSNSERKDFSTGIDSQIAGLDSSIIRDLSLPFFIIAVSSSGLVIYMGWHLLRFSNFLSEKVKTQSEQLKCTQGVSDYPLNYCACDDSLFSILFLKHIIRHVSVDLGNSGATISFYQQRYAETHWVLPIYELSFCFTAEILGLPFRLCTDSSLF